ncbi:transposase [Streptomyces sp. NPDC058964]|uniref:transposase n=1 Tax=Streptomyces sp. NPDC058964 TaxID=3346681 RepID=UPI0036A60F8B
MAGTGPDTAVTSLITVGDNPERLGSDVSFAALCGVSPAERSAGGHRIVQTRLQRRPAHPGLPRTPHQGGQDPSRNCPMPQTLRCPGGLPPGRAHTAITPVTGAVCERGVRRQASADAVGGGFRAVRCSVRRWHRTPRVLLPRALDARAQ